MQGPPGHVGGALSSAAASVAGGATAVFSANDDGPVTVSREAVAAGSGVRGGSASGDSQAAATEKSTAPC